MDYATTRRVLAAFERHSVEYKVFGGVALNLHGLARATEDLDVFIAPREENIDRLRAALKDVFDDPEIDEISAADLLGDYPAVQYVPPQGGFHVDILTRLGELYYFDTVRAEKLSFEGLEVPVATPQMLFEMKKATVRPKDWADASMLKERFELKD